MLRIARRAPRATPGKKPAMMARAGKEVQLALAVLLPPVRGIGVWFEEEVEVAGDVDSEVEVEEMDEDPALIVGVLLAVAGRVVWDGLVPWLGFSAHTLLELHEKPNGQHFAPQVCNVPLKFEVFIVASGNAVAFCWDTSQTMGWIREQSEPVGQQRTVVLLARTRHLVLEGQQKLEGAPGHCVSAVLPQVDALAKR